MKNSLIFNFGEIWPVPAYLIFTNKSIFYQNQRNFPSNIHVSTCTCIRKCKNLSLYFKLWCLHVYHLQLLISPELSA